ncbi:hypothetical protein [Nesterenkonia alkaliphila]|uniref:DNA-directed RNA polymerase subunit beta n=1 Tax=Nesterenkonia alkaliphila TaxID=1463631 RepID=A0A7K1UMC5_9MICC|nr:hypothetical protein [Nesterenkonia alkaliphila]MVT27629.1 hypothetical protein [Nesterenkonia alkaliphila]GFZ85691.1 hypothetical protein GCM10011359_13470 [Nesterenkonia alkaliphila]
MSNAPRYRRPLYSDPAAFDQRVGGSDPAQIAQAAHDTAHALISQGRDAADPEITERFVRLAETEGIEAIAELWAHSPARSLAGALWRIYVLRAAVQKSPERISEYYRLGRSHSAPSAIAGVAEPPSAEEMTRLADRILAGMYAGDIDVAFDRAGAFCRVVARGQALWADQRRLEHFEARALTEKAKQLLGTAEELESAARAHRAGTLD